MLDIIPQVWSGVIPIAVVGSVDFNGVISEFTQFGPNPSFPGSGVNIYAPGDLEITCADIVDNNGES